MPKLYEYFSLVVRFYSSEHEPKPVKSVRITKRVK